MTTYRTEVSSELGRWKLAIVREGTEVFTQGRMEPNGPVLPPTGRRSELVAVVVNGDQELAEDICFRLNSVTPDVPYTNGAREALDFVRRRLDELRAASAPASYLIVLGILRDAAAELGLDEDAPTTKDNA